MLANLNHLHSVTGKGRVTESFSSCPAKSGHREMSTLWPAMRTRAMDMVKQECRA